MNQPVVISPIVRCAGTLIDIGIMILGRDMQSAKWLSEYMEYGAETYGWREDGKGRIEHLNLN